MPQRESRASGKQMPQAKRINERAAERCGGEGVAALGGGARDVAGRGDERPAAAGPDSAMRLFGATGVAALKSGICHLKSSEAWSQPATARRAEARRRRTHVQPRLTHDNRLLRMQLELGERNCVAVGNVLRTTCPP